MNEKKKQEIPWMIFISIIVGTTIFLLLYGVAPLNVTYDDWLRGSDDISQHYLGWLAFRNAGWQFPLGLHDYLTNPYPISIVYTDSIPLFAIFFKLLSPILPETFQYFGIYILLSFILQAFLAILLVRRVSSSKVVWALTAILFVVTPVMLFRCFVHSALSGQFLILIAYCLWAYSEKLGYVKEMILWILLGVISVAIHLYFVPMIGLILAARILEGLLKKNWKTIVLMIGLAAGVFTSAWLLGIFSSGTSGSSWGLGYYNANLNALFNAQGKSHILKSLPYMPGQEEGFAYLGLGVILLLLIAVGIQLWKTKSRKNKINWKRVLTCTVLVIITLMLAMSVTWTWNDHELLTLSIPERLADILSIFRSSGRFMWVIIYGILIYAVYVIIRNQKKWVPVILAGCVLIQCLDVGTFYQRKVTYGVIETTDLDEFFMEASKDNTHVVMVNNINYYGTMGLRDDLFEIAWQAEKNHMTMNKFLCSRGEGLVEVWSHDTEKMMEELRIGNADRNTIYVFTKQYVWNEEFQDLKLYEVDGYIIGTYQEYEAAPYILENEFFEIELKKDYCVANGYDTEQGRILQENGISYGPYMTLKPGNYRVRITGQALDDCFYTVSPEVSLLEKNHTDTRIEYVFSLSEETDNIEFYVGNTGSENTILQSIIVWKEAEE